MPYVFSVVTLLLLLAGCNSATVPATAAAASGTPAFSIDRERITVSGISSGAYMASQFHVAHSALVSGAALLAGGPYWCAGGSVSKAMGPCVKGGDVEMEVIAGKVRQFAASGLIDDLSNLRNDSVWIFHGTNDQTVSTSVSRAARDFYLEFVPSEQVDFVDAVATVHGMPTEATGQPCDQFAAPFINACGYDAAGILLNQLYGELNAPATDVAELVPVSQAQYENAELAEQAWLYLPPECRAGAHCGLHIAFHGCAQSDEVIGDAFVTGAGYNEWAETNRIAVLYPQVRSSKVAPLNPLGCWDWWGYTGEQYATKEGAQIVAIRAMVDALSRDAS